MPSILDFTTSILFNVQIILSRPFLEYGTYSEQYLYGIQLICIQKNQTHKIVLTKYFSDQAIAWYHLSRPYIS